jgi:hypothetical protein
LNGSNKGELMSLLDIVTVAVGTCLIMMIFVAKTNMEKSKVKVKIKVKTPTPKKT